jgi:hypothetical protein
MQRLPVTPAGARDPQRNRDITDILDYIVGQYGEDGNGNPVNVVEVRGRTFASMLRRAREWERQAWYGIYRKVPPWENHGLDWQMKVREPDGSQVVWTFREMCRADELIQESEAMHHCVAGYAEWCSRGESAILSLRRNEERRLTVEIDPRTGRILQARGQCNVAPEPGEMAVLQRWQDEYLKTRLASFGGTAFR